jgi:hypothetical protein
MDHEDRLGIKIIQEHDAKKSQISISVDERTIHITGTPESFLMLSRLMAAQAIRKGMSPFGWNTVIPLSMIDDGHKYISEDSKYDLSFTLKQKDICEKENNFTEEDFNEVWKRSIDILKA